MAITYTTRSFRHFRQLDVSASFVLIGNAIDGTVNIGTHFFPDFEAMKAELPEIIGRLKGTGEWDISLYQVPDHFTIRQQYGYFEVPKPGKKIFSWGYMMAGQENEIHLNHQLLHLNSTSRYEKEADKTEVYEKYLTVCF